jgi:hypothetical protein
MNENKSASSRFERWIIGTLSGLLAVVIVVWAWIGSRQVLQIVFILAAFALALLAILSVVAWRHGLRWFFSRGAWPFYFWLVVGIISVTVLFYAEESWRGKRAWAALQREVASRGESLELSSVFPPAVPDQENFALSPGMPELLGPNGAAFYHGTRDKWPTASASWVWQQPMDLAAWQKFVRQHPLTASTPTNDDPTRLGFPVAPEPQAPAADVLLALSRYEAGLGVLRAADQRPKVRYPIAYEDGVFALHRRKGHFEENLYRAVHILSLRAIAELAQSDSGVALQDTLLALRLADSLRQEPYDQLHGTRAEMLMFCLQPVWEGLAGHKWNEAQLLTLEQRFGQMDLLEEFRLLARGETLLMMNIADQFQAFLEGRGSAWGRELASADGDDLAWVWAFRIAYPSGWLYQDKVWVYRFYQRRPDVFRALAMSDWRQMEGEMRRATDPALLIMVVPRLRQVFTDAAQTTLFLQTACQEAVVACALERYRLAQGQYPESLGVLVPAWLKRVPTDLLAPNDVPLKYRREGEGGFVLYSIGLNRQDDLGKSVPPQKDWRGTSVTFPPLDEGDWVWAQPGRP